MSPEADYIVDRRQMRRRLTLWRVLAFAGAAVAVLALGLLAGGREVLKSQQSHVARIAIEGLITGDKETLALIRRVKEASAAKAVVVEINSPGGTTTGSEAVHKALRDLVAAKPAVAVVTGTAASGAYIAAMGTDHIVAPQTAIIGSIGVLVQYPNFTRLLDTVGVKVEAVRSSPLKAQPSGVEPTPPEARAALEATILDSYAWFRDMVKDRRKLSDAELQKVADGRVFTGRQSVPLKLIDALGGEAEGIRWLETERKVAEKLPVVEYKKPSAAGRLGIMSLAAGLAEAVGASEFAASLRGSERSLALQSLDGVLAVWQPHAQN